MSDSENKQWFEREDNGSKKNQKKPSGKKPQMKGNNRPSNSARNGGHNVQARSNGKPDNRPSQAQRPNPNKNANSVQNKPLDRRNNGEAVNKPAAPKNNKPADVKTSKAAAEIKKGKKNKRKFKLKAPKKQQVEVKETTKKSPETAAAATKVNTGFDKAKANKERKSRGRKWVLNKSLVAIGFSLLLILVLVFVVHHLFDYIAAKPELTFISNGSVEHTIGARALIVRDEVLVGTDTTGDLVTQATEGSRVYKNQRIGMVVPENMQTVVDSLRNTQSQISEVQQELIQTGLAEGADRIYEDFNAGLNPIIDMVRLDAMDGKISGMSSYASSIAVLLNQRETTLAELDFDDERLRVLRSDEAAYENQLSRNASTIRATSPGVVSFRLDGLEGELNFNVLLEADIGTLFSYVNNSVGVIPADLSVESGDSVARIASNERQYIACFLDERTATVDSFAVGTKHTINIGSEGISIGKCVVERVEPSSHGLYVVFSTTRYVEDLLDLRTVDIEVVINETEGLRVPISSLVNADYDRNIASIYVNNQGFCDEVGVIIEDYDREFAIICPIGDGSVPNLHTVIITNPSSIKPGDKVDN